MHFIFQKLFGLAYKIFKPFMFKFTTADEAHAGMIKFGNWAGNSRILMFLLKFSTQYNNIMLHTSAFGYDFQAPIGLAAGLDKDAKIAKCIANVGFNMGTFGSMTAKYCPGNPKPWFHRLLQYKSMLIHAGLANAGIDANLEDLQRSYDNIENFYTGVSVARTNLPDSSGSIEDGIADFKYSFEKAIGSVHFIEINISCPNTYCGEPFTTPERLEKLLAAIDTVPRDIPVTLKMPSDKTWKEFRDLLDVILQHNIQGITIANLFKDRTDYPEIPKDWRGNMSGKPCVEKSNYLIAKSFKHTRGKLTIIGLGGITTAEDAYDKIKAGASIVEIGSGLMFTGPHIVAEVKRGLVKLLKRDNYTRIRDAVGVSA
jgi:dihydroorotate dehydrogenase (fumarate)